MHLCRIPLLLAVSSAAFTGWSGAALSFTAAGRTIEDLPTTTTLSPLSEFDDFNEAFQLFATEPLMAGRLLSRASQQSMLRSDFISVTSSVGGQGVTGRSFLQVTFTLEEPTSYTLAGMIGLSGRDGFVCVSLVDLAHHDLPLIESYIAGRLPLTVERSLNYGGILPAGTFTLDAMIYAGGGTTPSSGNLNVLFAIPEPAGCLALAE